MKPLNTSSNAAGTAGGLGIHPSESWVVWVCACVCIVLYWPNKPPICRERRTVDAGSMGGVTALFMLHIYTPFKCTDRQIHSPAQRFFDACRYRCVMMSYGREQGREAWSKERGRDEDAGEDIQDNNGTKMATASAMGRPLASRPPHHQEELWPCSKCIQSPYSNRMTTSMTHWNHQANLSHHYRRASTVSSPSTLAFPPLPLNHQTLNAPMSGYHHSIPSIYHELPFFLITHFLPIFFLFLSPFIMVFWLLI